MAWTPPTQKAFEPGEIPGKKTISAEEQANLDKYRPEKDVVDMMGGDSTKILEQGLTPTEAQTSILDEIFQESENQDISALLDEWKENDEFGLLGKVLEDDFLENLEDRLDVAGKDYDSMEVAEVAYAKELRPIMFYFGMGMMNDEMVVIMTPIPEWEIHQRWNDQSLADYVIPDFLSRLTESIYSFDSDDMTASKVRKQLVKLGFMEKHEIADLL